jgi:hypothetical protein
MTRPRKQPSLIKAPELIEIHETELDVRAWVVRKWIRQGQVPAPAIDNGQKARFWRRADIETWLHGKAA